MSDRRWVQLFTWPLILLVRFYQWVISPLIHLVAPGSGCRYHPSCSDYALGALARFGALRGGWVAFRRLMDCHPWGGSGVDPVPLNWPGWFYSRKVMLKEVSGMSESASPEHSYPADF